MKYLLLILLLLAACSPNITEKANITVVTNTTVQNSVETNKTIDLDNMTKAINVSQQAEDNQILMHKTINGTSHTIEVVDVDDAGKSCLIRVDGNVYVINEGETKTLNGVRIFVSEVRVFRSALQDNDACELVIS